MTATWPPRRSARRSSYNLIDRAAEDKLVPACQQFGLLRRRAAAGDAIRPARLDHLRRCDLSGQAKPGRLALRDHSARPMTCSQPDLRSCPSEREAMISLTYFTAQFDRFSSQASGLMGDRNHQTTVDTPLLPSIITTPALSGPFTSRPATGTRSRGAVCHTPNRVRALAAALAGGSGSTVAAFGTLLRRAGGNQQQ
jgi:hypothetical protein